MGNINDNEADHKSPEAFFLGNMSSLKREAVMNYKLGKYEEALNTLNIADEILSNDALTLFYRGATKLALGDHQGALDDLNRADEIQPANAFTLQNRAEAKRMLGDLQGSLEDLNRADYLQPNDAYTLQQRGETKRVLCNFKGALEDLNRSDEIQPNNAHTLWMRGATKRVLGDYQGALEDLDRADKIEPNHVLTISSRGVTKLMLRDFEGALDDLDRANEMQPNDAFTLQYRAIVRYHLCDFSRALEDITQALKYSNDKESVNWKLKIEEKVNQFISIPSEQRIDDKKPNRIIPSASPVAQQSKTRRSGSTAVQEGVIQVPFSQLKVIKTVGQGGFGEVSLAEWHGNKVALKKLKSSVAVDDESHEARSLMLLRHKCIVTLMGITTDPVTNSTILIMEYMKHGSLDDLLTKQKDQKIKLSRASVIRLALDIALGVNYLHSQSPKVLHRDLKSANVLLHRKKRRAKIADFGTAKFLDTFDQANTVIGNLNAMPPEMLAEEIYDEKVDVFAFGTILFEMLTNNRLLIMEENTRLKRIRENIDDAKLLPLVLACCRTDPKKRPHMRDIIDLLRKIKNGSIS